MRLFRIAGVGVLLALSARVAVGGGATATMTTAQSALSKGNVKMTKDNCLKPFQCVGQAIALLVLLLGIRTSAVASESREHVIERTYSTVLRYR